MAPGECCDKVLWLIIPFWKALWTKQITQAEKRNVIIPYIAEERRTIRGARDTYINSTEPRFHLETLNDSSTAIPKVRGDHITFIPLITQFFSGSPGLPVTTADSRIFSLDSSVKAIPWHLLRVDPTGWYSSWLWEKPQFFCSSSMSHLSRFSSSRQEQEGCALGKAIDPSGNRWIAVFH